MLINLPNVLIYSLRWIKTWKHFLIYPLFNYGTYCISQTVWPLWKKLIRPTNEWFHLLDRSPPPPLVTDVSAVSLAVPCRLDIKHNLKPAAIFTICSEVSTHCPDRHKATEPCLVYQKHLTAKIIFFSINQDWQRGKIGRVLSRAHGQELCEF